jgi:hypothetical protein
LLWAQPTKRTAKLLSLAALSQPSFVVYLGALVGAPLESPVAVFGFPSTLRTALPVAFLVEW